MRAASSSGANTPKMPHFSRHVSELIGVGGVAAGFFLCTDNSCRRGRTRAGEQAVRQHGDKERRSPLALRLYQGGVSGGNAKVALSAARPPAGSFESCPYACPAILRL